MTIELCQLCNSPTGNAGKYEDSIYFEVGNVELGPLCSECACEYWYCTECDTYITGEEVTYEETHDGCGGACG